MSRSIPTASKDVLERDIERLSARMLSVPEGRDLKARCTRAYLKALMEQKRQTLVELNRQGRRD